MEYRQLASDLLRALRGRRSQRGFSRRLGYSTNVAYTWESARRFPTAARTLAIAEMVRIDVRAALGRFFRVAPPWLADTDPTTPEGVVALLGELRGNMTTVELARRSGLSRHAIGRWLTGQAVPRLPDFLRVVEAASERALDLVATLVDPATLPSVAEHWAALVARRVVAQELPWSQAVLRMLETTEYRALPAHRPGWIAHQLGIGADEEGRCLVALEEAGQVVWDGRRYQPDEVLTVDTRPDPAAGRRMRVHWASVAIDHIERGRPGQFSYNVFACSREDFERIREMHLAYFRALRAIVAESAPAEIVAVANVQLFEIEGG